MRLPLSVLLIGLSATVQADPTVSTEQINGETFQVWHQANDGFRMYCREPCQAEPDEIRAYYGSFRSHLPDLVDWHGIDVVEALKPVEMHLNASDICPGLSGAAGYARVSRHRGWDDPIGLTCLFEIGPDQAPLDEKRPILALHEYAHVILFERHRWSYEWFAYWAPWAVYDADNDYADPCSSYYGQFAPTRTMHLLCTEFGLTAADVRGALIELDRRFRQDEGFLATSSNFGAMTSLAELRELLDADLSADTAPAFIEGGWRADQIGMSFDLGPEPAVYDGVAGRIRIEALEATLDRSETLRLDRPQRATGSLPMPQFQRIFSIVPEDGDQTIDSPSLSFNRPVSFGIEPDRHPLITQPIEDFILVEQHIRPDGAFWRPVEGSGYNAETGRVEGELSGTGNFAYGPPFRFPSGMFYDPDYSGHGFDIQMIGETVMVVLFTYDRSGDPIWLIGSGSPGNLSESSASKVEIEMWRYERHNGSLSGTPEGKVTMRVFGRVGGAGWTFDILTVADLPTITGAEPVMMRLERLGFGNEIETQKQVTGHWYAPDDSGWGISIDRKGRTESAVAFFHDAQGEPRWAIGARDISDPVTNMDTVQGYCLDCSKTGTSVQAAGSVDLAFAEQARVGTVDIEVSWPPGTAQRWTRSGADIRALSSPPVYRIAPSPPPSRQGAASRGESMFREQQAGSDAGIRCAMPGLKGDRQASQADGS
jgi:hypothetical protein